MLFRSVGVEFRGLDRVPVVGVLTQDASNFVDVGGFRHAVGPEVGGVLLGDLNPELVAMLKLFV